jgi:hypothetical protein
MTTATERGAQPLAFAELAMTQWKIQTSYRSTAITGVLNNEEAPLQPYEYANQMFAEVSEKLCAAINKLGS